MGSAASRQATTGEVAAGVLAGELRGTLLTSHLARKPKAAATAPKCRVPAQPSQRACWMAACWSSAKAVHARNATLARLARRLGSLLIPTGYRLGTRSLWAPDQRPEPFIGRCRTHLLVPGRHKTALSPPNEMHATHAPKSLRHATPRKSYPSEPSYRCVFEARREKIQRVRRQARVGKQESGGLQYTTENFSTATRSIVGMKVE